jgi:hypothetical protein
MTNSIKMTIASTILLATTFWASGAQATCDFSSNPSHAECWPPWSLEFPYDPVTVFFGTDPNDGNSQWINWRNDRTGECNHWDYIGDGWGVAVDLTIWGNFGNDFISVPNGNTICGYYMTPPIMNGNSAALNGDAGNDILLDWVGSSVIDGGEGDDIIHSYANGSFLFGSYGNDTIWATSTSAGTIVDGSDGNDFVRLQANSFNLCGDGNDLWCAPGPKPGDCENVWQYCAF